MKQLKRLAYLLMFIFLANCQKEEFGEQTQRNVSTNITVEQVSLDDINATISSQITQKVSDIKIASLKKGDQGKFEYNNELNIYIDFENGNLVNNDGHIYYTFPMYRESEKNLENIVFVPLDNDEVETYIAKYNVTPDTFLQMSLNEKENLEPELQKMVYESPEYVCVDFITTTTTTTTQYPNCDQPGVPHSNGQICSPIT